MRRSCGACHAKWRWRSLKCCACQEKCNSSKVLRLPHKTTLDTFGNMLECHKVPRLPRETRLRDVWTSKRDHFCRTRHRHGHTALARTVANGCGRLHAVERTQPQPPAPKVKREPLLRIREKLNMLKQPNRQPENSQFWWMLKRSFRRVAISCFRALMTGSPP